MSGADSWVASFGCWVISYWTRALFSGQAVSWKSKLVIGCLDILVIGQIECLGMPLQAFVIRGNGAHKEAHRFGSITRAPFLASFFLFHAN